MIGGEGGGGPRANLWGIKVEGGSVHTFFIFLVAFCEHFADSVSKVYSDCFVE